MIDQLSTPVFYPPLFQPRLHLCVMSVMSAVFFRCYFVVLLLSFPKRGMAMLQQHPVMFPNPPALKSLFTVGAEVWG